MPKNSTLFSTEKPLTVEDMNKLVQQSQIVQTFQDTQDSADNIPSQAAVQNKFDEFFDLMHQRFGEIFDLIYPVGSIYATFNDALNPNTAFGGTWNKIQNVMLVSKGNVFDRTKATGGSADSVVVAHSHTLSDHTHTVSGHTAREGSHEHAVRTFTDAGGGGSTQFGMCKPMYAPGYWGSLSNAACAIAGNANEEGYGDPIHRHGVNLTSSAARLQPGTAGVSGAKANMPPYIVCNMWERVA